MQKQAVITLLAQVYAPETQMDLMAYTTETATRARNEALVWIEQNGDCFAQLQHAAVASNWSHLQEVHPAWMFEILKNESPQVIGILLRFVPSRHARYIVDHLPTRVKEKIPHYVDAFSVPTAIVQMLRRRFESHFTPMTRHFAGTEFDQIAALGFDEVPVLLSDLGLHELAMAFADADPRSIQILENRLSIQDARQLKERIRHLGEIPAALARDAKYTILETVSADRFLQEIGLMAFAKSLGMADAPISTIIRQKLEPKDAQVLQRRHGASPDLIALRKQLTMERLSILARAGALDPKWQLMASPQIPAETGDLAVVGTPQGKTEKTLVY